MCPSTHEQHRWSCFPWCHSGCGPCLFVLLASALSSFHVLDFFDIFNWANIISSLLLSPPLIPSCLLLQVPKTYVLILCSPAFCPLALYLPQQSKIAWLRGNLLHTSSWFLKDFITVNLFLWFKTLNTVCSFLGCAWCYYYCLFHYLARVSYLL